LSSDNIDETLDVTIKKLETNYEQVVLELNKRYETVMSLAKKQLKWRMG